MTRAHRLRVEGGLFHLTHRCHNRAFLLKFARDRNAYRTKMREKLKRFDLSLLDYNLTCNHVHLIIDAKERMQVSGFMREVAGEFAKAYNKRKGHRNAFWGDNFHACLIDTNTYLWRCLRYVNLNMVRCGKVAHPSQWEWQGYHEIMGHRQRYRLLDLDRLCWRLGAVCLKDVRVNLEALIHEAITQQALNREPCWTESLAVGSQTFVEGIQPMIMTRQETETVEEESGLWRLKEASIPYITISATKSHSKPDFSP